jgi:LAO/AO transport system kinase
VTNPGWGDSMQANKAGLLEVADIFVINKADRPGVRETRRDLEQMLDLGRARAWRPLIVEATATKNEGVDALFEALDAHRRYLDATTLLDARRARTRVELDNVVSVLVRSRVEALAKGKAYEAQIDALLEGTTDPYRAAEKLLAES